MSEYQFSFDKKRLILGVAGLLFAGILTFCCGVITGIGLLMPAQQELAQLRAKLKPPIASAAAKPSIKLPALPGKESIPAALASTAAPITKPQTAPATIVPAPSAIPPNPAAVVPATSASLAVAPDSVNQPFILQLGAFREQKNAKQLQADLKLKGYPTTIFNMMDEDQRTWHMVRFGGYKDLSTASDAASNFIGKEGIQALVRRTDSL